FETVSVQGANVRVMYWPFHVGGDVGAVIQVGESLRPMERTLERTRLILLVGGACIIVSGVVGGWLIARQALRPVRVLTDSVAEIARTGEFNRRVQQPETNDEIGRLAATFNELLDRLGLLVSRQRALVADTSHELRNPLMVVRGNLELIAHNDLPARERAEAVADSLEEVDRMTRLVSDLLFLADADTRESIYRDAVQLNEIVESIAEDAALIATRDDGDRHVVLEVNDPLVVRGDPLRLRQLVWNLVENAVRYTPAGGTVTLSLRRLGAVAELTVSDTGIGIPPEHLPHIFERFYRVDRGRSRALGGTGLGLSIVRQVAESHGGQVRVRSKVGEGSTFTVALPVAG
ncbi:MAG: sensor histidine kinase, partial [Chloroflexi bacterium]